MLDFKSVIKYTTLWINTPISEATIGIRTAATKWWRHHKTVWTVNVENKALNNAVTSPYWAKAQTVAIYAVILSHAIVWIVWLFIFFLAVLLILVSGIFLILILLWSAKLTILFIIPINEARWEKWKLEAVIRHNPERIMYCQKAAYFLTRSLIK